MADLTGIDDILGISSEGEFERVAMEVFRRQAVVCPPYREYLEAIGVAPESVGRVTDIPFLPIELFKTHKVYCGGEGGVPTAEKAKQNGACGGAGANADYGGRGAASLGADCRGEGGGEDEGGAQSEPEAVFTSSSTSGEGVSKHYVASLADYERVFTRGFELFYGSPTEWSIYALLPAYLEREGSSLVYMAEGLIRRGRDAGRKGGFYLYDHAALMRDVAADGGQKILLGVSYALLDLAEELARRGEKLPVGTVVMETGGMKGRRREMPKEELHAVLCRDLGVERVHSEYGMAELTSQAYSFGGGVFDAPPWMKVMVRDLADPLDVRSLGRGGINIIDLANLHSCAFIQTQDIGRVAEDGSFTIDGRVAKSDVRGCNLLVQ